MNFSLALGLVGIALLMGLATIMAKRRLYGQFPFFFLYICYSVAASIAVNAAGLGTERSTFVKIYWVTETLYTVVGLVAMYESSRKTLQIYFFSKRWVFLLPLAVVLVVLLISAFTLRKHAPVQANPLGILYFSFFLASDYMLAGLFGLFVILVILWQAPWQRYAFGIMKGFGLFSIVGMLADLLRSQFGTKWDFFFSYAPSVAYILGCLIWLGAFLAPEQRKAPAGLGSAVDLDEILELLSKLKKVIK